LIIDTHVHLDHEMYSSDLEEVLNRARERGVEKFIIPGADPRDLERAKELAERESDIFFAVGVHPYHIDDWSEDIFSLLTHEKCIAVGECGLDYYRLPEDKNERIEVVEKQKYIFKRQIEIAKQHNKPIIVHIRDASEDSKEILLEGKADSVGGVLHCFNADRTLLELADHNFYFGIGGVATFKNGKRLVSVIPEIPEEKLILETDAPYLTPHPYRGKRNEPAYTTFVAERVGEILNISSSDIADITTENSRRLFNFYD
jgi:TatD DNase family protein